MLNVIILAILSLDVLVHLLINAINATLDFIQILNQTFARNVILIVKNVLYFLTTAYLALEKMKNPAFTTINALKAVQQDFIIHWSIRTLFAKNVIINVKNVLRIEIIAQNVNKMKYNQSMENAKVINPNTNFVVLGCFLINKVIANHAIRINAWHVLKTRIIALFAYLRINCLMVIVFKNVH